MHRFSIWCNDIRHKRDWKSWNVSINQKMFNSREYVCWMAIIPNEINNLFLLFFPWREISEKFIFLYNRQARGILSIFLLCLHDAVHDHIDVGIWQESCKIIRETGLFERNAQIYETWILQRILYLMDSIVSSWD